MGFAATVSFQLPQIRANEFEMRVKKGIAAVGTPFAATREILLEIVGDNEPQEMFADELDANVGKSW